MRFCTNCGTPVGGSPRYCAGCGLQVDPAPATTLTGMAAARAARPRVAPPAADHDSWASPGAGDDPWTPPATGPDSRALPAADPDLGPWASPAASPVPGQWASPAASPADDPDPWASPAAGPADGLGPWTAPVAGPGDSPWEPAPWTAAGGGPVADPWAGPIPSASCAAWPGPDTPGTATFPAQPTPQVPAGHPQAGVTGRAGAVASAPDPLRTAPAQPPRPAHSGRRTTIVAMVTTLGLLVTAGVASWQVSELSGSSAPGAASHPAASHPAASHPAQAQPGHGGASVSGHGRPGSSTRLAAPTAARPPATPPSPIVVGNNVVSVSPAVLGAPQAQPVVGFLTDYFDAINSHNFAQYARLFIPSIRSTMQHFGMGYAMTADSGVLLTGLAATGPEGLAATVAFTSHQAPAASPDHAACDQWIITLFLKHTGGGYLIRHPRPGFPQSVRACS
jgi:hypothetical protein